jgi:hypothetical protein
VSPTKPKLTRLVRNRSSREGTRPVLIPLHTTEGSNHPGITDLEGLASLFDTTGSQASSTVANDGEGNDARFCRDEDKPWTQAAVNRWSLSIEQIGFASTTRAQWFAKYSHQLANTARWIAHWHRKWGIPIRRGFAPAGIPIRSGVVSHKQLGIPGGGHTDPGPGYPFKYVLLLARYFAAQDKGNKAQADRFADKINPIRRHYGLEAL